MRVCILYVNTLSHTHTHARTHTHTHTPTPHPPTHPPTQVKCKDELSDLWERLVAEKERSLALAQVLLQLANKMELDLPDEAAGSHTLIVHALKQALPEVIPLAAMRAHRAAVAAEKERRQELEKMREEQEQLREERAREVAARVEAEKKRKLDQIKKVCVCVY